MPLFKDEENESLLGQLLTEKAAGFRRIRKKVLSFPPRGLEAGQNSNGHCCCHQERRGQEKDEMNKRKKERT